MDTKKQFADQVLAEMSANLSSEDLQKLSNILDSNLKNVSIVPQSTEIMSYQGDVNAKYIKLFVASRRLEGMSEVTISKYVFWANQFFDFANKDFTDVSTVDIQFFLAEYERTHNICKRTLDNLRKGVNGFFYWLAENEYIISNPVARVKPIAYEKKAIEVLTDDEIMEIRDYIHNDVRERAIIETLLSTGVRVSELLQIQIKDLNIEDGEITIHCAKKHQKQDRVLFLTAEAKKSIKDYLNLRQKKGWIDSPYLFVANKRGGKVLTERLVNERLRKIEAALGLQKHLTVHMFRKTLASILYRRGMQPLDIAYILGHADTRMSETYYIGIKNEDVKRNFGRFR